MTDNTVDHEARNRADIANHKIDSHEERCGERWREAHDTMREIRDGQKEQDAKINRILWAFIAGQGAVIAALASNIL